MLKIKVSNLLGEHKMTQKDLSERTGIRPGTVSAMYHETIKRLDVDHIEKLCKVFDCQPNDIFEYVPDEEASE